MYLKFHFTTGQNITETITCSLMQWYSEITIYEENTIEFIRKTSAMIKFLEFHKRNMNYLKMLLSLNN